MSRKFLILFVFLIFIGGLLSPQEPTQKRGVKPVESKKEKDKNQKIALVIGNSAYKESPLKNPVNDANDMAEVLKKCGFEIILKTNANQHDMEKAVRKFSDRLKDGGVGLFYFSGHGVQVDGINYLIPVNSNIQDEIDVKAKSVSANYILGKMDRRKDGMNIIILDACRNNPYARSFRSPSTGLAQMDAPKGSLIVYATSPGKKAEDGTGRNGIFTKHLLEMIKETPFEIMVLLRKVRENVMTETNEKQIPWEASSLLGSFYFSYTDTQLEKIKAEISELQPQIKDQEVQTQEFEKIKSEKEEREAARKEEEKKAQLKLKKLEEERLLKEKERQERLKQEEERLDQEEARKREERRKQLAEEKVRLEELKKKVDEESKKMTKMKQREMSLSEARKEVESLEAKVNEITTQITSEKENALKKLDEDYKPKKDKLKPIGPKDQFEKTTDYNARVKKRNEEIIAMEKQYESDKAEVEKKFNEKANLYTKVYIERIKELNEKSYLVDGLKVDLIKYNADMEIYILKLVTPDGEKLNSFIRIKPEKARALYKRKNLLMVEGYCKGLKDTRNLFEIAFIDSISILEKLPLTFFILRPTYKTLNENEIESMIKKKGFFESQLNGNGDFPNRYELKIINSDKVVIDHAPGLMWHQSGSDVTLTFEEAKAWIKELNRNNYAGYNDWRLPTVEEVLTLAENSKKNGDLYIDPLFSSDQRYIWTGDLSIPDGIWVINFVSGIYIYDARFQYESYVRPMHLME